MSCVAQVPGDQLRSWAESNGAVISKKVAFLVPTTTGDRVVRAEAFIEEDEVLLELPRCLAFEVPETPGSGPIGVPRDLLDALRSRQLESGDGPARKNVFVALLVHLEYMRGTLSKFLPYISSLPSEFSTMPLIDECPPWSSAHGNDSCGGEQDEPWMYRGTGVDLLARSRAAPSGPEGIAMMRKLIGELDPEMRWWPSRPDDVSLRWAAASVQSRAHATKAGGTILIPLADAFNHSPSKPNCEVVEEAGLLKVVALQKVAAGEELLLSYGNFSNAELLFNAGFTCWPNDHDTLLISPPALMAAARQRWRCRGQTCPDLESRMEVLWSASMLPPRLGASAPLVGGAVPTRAITLLVGLSLDDERWQALLADGMGSGTVHELWAGTESEAAALRGEALAAVALALRGAVVPRYAATSAESDRAALVAAEAALVVSLAGSAAAGGAVPGPATGLTPETTPAAGPEAAAASPVAGRRDIVGLLRRVNALRVRVGERSILAKLDAAIVSRSGGASGGGLGGSAIVGTATGNLGAETVHQRKRLRTCSLQTN